jgi:hypothetical protein
VVSFGFSTIEGEGEVCIGFSITKVCIGLSTLGEVTVGFSRNVSFGFSTMGEVTLGFSLFVSLGFSIKGEVTLGFS